MPIYGRYSFPCVPPVPLVRPQAGLVWRGRSAGCLYGNTTKSINQSINHADCQLVVSRSLTVAVSSPALLGASKCIRLLSCCSRCPCSNPRAAACAALQLICTPAQVLNRACCGFSASGLGTIPGNFACFAKASHPQRSRAPRPHFPILKLILFLFFNGMKRTPHPRRATCDSRILHGITRS